MNQANTNSMTQHNEEINAMNSQPRNINSNSNHHESINSRDGRIPTNRSLNNGARSANRIVSANQSYDQSQIARSRADSFHL